MGQNGATLIPLSCFAHQGLLCSLSSDNKEDLDEIPCRIIVLTPAYATHIFAYAVHLEQEGLTQTLRDTCFARNAADTTTRAYALHILYNAHLLHLIFRYGC